MLMANLIDRAMVENGISNVELAGLLNVGTITVTRWKLGEESPNANALRKMIQIFQVADDYFDKALSKPLCDFQDYRTCDIQCPFYRSSGASTIVCEGIDYIKTLKGVVSGSVKITFVSPTMLIEHRNKHCKSLDGCKECPFYKIAEKKWGK